MTASFCSGALPPRPCGPAPTGLVVARFRRLRLLNRGRMCFAHGIRPPPLGRPRFLLRGFAPAALRACPHALGRGSVSSASPPQPWADALRTWYPPTATRAPALFAQGLCPRGPAVLPPRAWSWLGFVGFASSTVGGCAARIVSAHRHSGARAFCSGALPPRPCGPAPRAWSWLGFVGFASSAVGGC